MPSCESCQARLLDYLYDLLDAEERSSLQMHLVDCPACQASLAQATRQRGLLATAARLEFPEVSFHPPVAPDTQDTPAPQTIPIRVMPVPVSQRGRTRPQPVRHWGRYAAAAVVVLALGSVVLSGQWLSASHAGARREVDAGAGRVAEARVKLDQAAGRAEEVCQIHNTQVAEYRAASTWHGVPPEAAKTQPEYITLLATDRPVYRSGLDTIHCRALVLDRYSLRPVDKDLRLIFELTDLDQAGAGSGGGQNAPLFAGLNEVRAAGKVRSNKMEALAARDGNQVRSIGARDFYLDANAPEGEYLLTVRDANGRIPPQQQSLHVRRAAVPMQAKVEYEHNSYQAGDKVTAYAHPAAPDQQNLPDKKVKVLVNVDGRNYGFDGKEAREGAPARTDNFGNLKLEFKLPDTIKNGQALLLAEVEDATEPLVSAIPLELKRVQVTFFPEGGTLVAGRANRVYFQCHTPAGAPAELRGLLLIDGKPSDLVVATAADTPGTGVFELTPEVGKKYSVRVVAPAAFGYRAALPEVTDAVGLRIDKPVAGPGQSVGVRILRRDAGQPLVLALSCRGHLLDSLLLAPGQTEATLKAEGSAGGVLQVTAYEEYLKRSNPAVLGLACGGVSGELAIEQRQLVPVARRLVYRQPADRLDVTMRPEQKGDETVLSLATADAKGNPVPALALVTVTYRSPTEAAANAPTMPLLTELPRAEGAGEPDLLVVSGTASDEALDRVLATHPAPAAAETAGGDSVLEVLTQALLRTRREAEEKRRSSEETAEELAAARGRLAEARESFEEARDNPAYQAALARLAEDGRLFEEFRSLVAPVLTGLLVVALLASVVSAIRRSRIFPWCLAGAACAGLWLAILLTAGKQQTPAAPADGPPVALATTPEPTPAPWPVPPQPQAADTVRKVEQEKQGGGQNEGMKRMDKMDAVNGGLLVPGKPGGMANGSLTYGEGKNKNADERTVALSKQLADQQEQLPPPSSRRLANRAAVPAPFPGNQGVAGNAVPVPAAAPARFAADTSWLTRLTLSTDAGDRASREGGKAPGKDTKEAKGAAAQAGTGQAPAAQMRAIANERSRAVQPVVLPAQTLYWHPALLLPDGRVQVAFDPGEPGFAYQVTVFAHTADGRLGAQTLVLPPRSDVPSK